MVAIGGNVALMLLLLLYMTFGVIVLGVSNFNANVQQLHFNRRHLLEMFQLSPEAVIQLSGLEY
ncbi:hypothetical protein D3C73_1633130 [compost metagenome]